MGWGRDRGRDRERDRNIAQNVGVMIWGEKGERRGNGGRVGQGQMRGTGTGILHKMLLF